MRLYRYAQPSACPQSPTPSSVKIIGALDLVTADQAREHCAQWQEKQGYLKPERLRELDVQALAWALFEAFEACPSLARMELMEAPEQPSLNFASTVLMGCFATDPPPADAEPWATSSAPTPSSKG